ncbi:PDZ domain-containing protein [bacterium]|nr:MAG: PDZ domain-containing protein [bacterium]
MDHPIRTSKSVYLTLGAGFGLGAICMAGVLNGRVPVATLAHAAPQVSMGKPQLASSGMSGLPELRTLDASFRTLAREVGPAVVDIKAGHGGEDGRVTVSEGEGSGFLISGDGWIVTNDHVVDGAKTVTVTLKDGRTFEGKVTPSNDETSDIAVVKIEAKSLPYLSFADSATVEPGEFAIAVGAPFGLENTVTIGHVSALGRSTNIGGQGKMRGYSDLIQTDAAINMGNSGGPLVNVDGQVIGMNTAIYSPTGGSNGIGFAIPSNQVRLISNLLMTKGKLTRSMIGVEPQDVKEYERTGLLKDGGARVVRLTDDGAAKAAGLKEGDVIVRIGERPIRGEMDLRNAMLAYAPGTPVDIEYVRNGSVQKANAKLKAYQAQTLPAPPSPFGGRRPRNGDNPFEQFNIPGFGKGENPFDLGEPRKPEERKAGEPAHLGVQIADVDESVRAQFELPKTATGVVIVSVEPGSVAAGLGIKPGDVIESIDGKSVGDGRSLKEAMNGVKWGDKRRIKTVRYSDGARMETTRDVLFK